MRSLLLMAIAFVLLACGQTRLVKDGMTQEQFEADKSECKQKVLTMYRGSDRVAFGDAPTMGSDMTKCMVSKGYREVKQ